MKEIDGIAHEARRAGFSLNFMVSINLPRLPSSTDGEHKKRLRRKIDDILKPTRRCHGEVMALWVFENQDGILHAHLLIHVHEGLDGIVTRWHELPDIHVRKADSRAVEYVTKQRRWLGMDLEARLNRMRRNAEPVPGKRWSMSRDLLELVNEAMAEPVLRCAA